MEGLHILYINWLFVHTHPHHLHCTLLGALKIAQDIQVMGSL